MQIVLNGQLFETAATTVSALVVEMGLETRMIAVELNLNVVPKSAYGTTILEAGDRLEVVHMIGGG
ncbi:MAG: sulfur carrier protein ThiS [Zetaproteobacteria bacterium]|nr:sulfur carrier protein ThiS [Zetaproteobacteria bacterium]